MGVRLKWVGKDLDIELGEILKMAQELKSVGPLAGINELFTDIEAFGIRGIELDENRNALRVETDAAGE